MLHSVFLYSCFIVFIRTPLPFFLAVLGLLMISYLISLKIKFVKAAAPPAEDDDDASAAAAAAAAEIDTLKEYSNIVNILSVIVAASGFFVYLGLKKIEYSGRFSYYKFLLGDNKCREKSPAADYITALRAIFK